MLSLLRTEVAAAEIATAVSPSTTEKVTGAVMSCSGVVPATKAAALNSAWIVFFPVVASLGTVI